MDWNDRYQEGDTPWDQNCAHPWVAAMRRRVGRRWRVLVPGCGRGHDVAALALTFPDAEVVGVDISPAAIDQSVDLPDNASLIAGDLFALGDHWKNSVDLVWEHTCFCAITPEMRTTYRDTIAGLLKPGGFLIGAFFLSMIEGPGGGPPFNTDPVEFAELFSSDYGLTLHRLGLLDQTFPQRAGEEWLAVVERVE